MRASLQDEVLDLCRQILAIPSQSGQEGPVIDCLAAYFRQKGVTDLHRDAYGSLTARIKGDRPGLVLLLDGHVDAVPIGSPDLWTYPPYGGVLDQSRLYGRGSSDMKGAVAAMAVAMTHFLKVSEGRFAGSLVFAGTVHEELFEGVAARSISDYCQPDLVIIGEATGLNLNRGQRGRAEIKVETLGISAHSSNPKEGNNAVYRMTDAIRALASLPPPHDPLLGPGILELTDIQSSPYPGASVIPAYCAATYDRRLLPGEEPGQVLAPVKRVLAQLGMIDGKAAARASYVTGKDLTYTGQPMEAERFFPGWLFHEDEWFVQKALGALKQAGLDSRLSHYGFCTNGSHYAGEKKIPTLGFGPSHEKLAHIADEYIETDQLYGALDGYLALLAAFLGQDSQSL